MRLEGELSIAVAAARRDALLEAMSTPEFAGFDLSGITLVDGAGVQLLMLAAREARFHGIPLMATEPSRAVLDALGLARLGLDLEPLPQHLDCCGQRGRA